MGGDIGIGYCLMGWETPVMFKAIRHSLVSEASDWRTVGFPAILGERISKCRSNARRPPISGYKNAAQRMRAELPVPQRLRVSVKRQVQYLSRKDTAFLIDVPIQTVLGDYVLPSNLADIGRSVTARLHIDDANAQTDSSILADR